MTDEDKLTPEELARVERVAVRLFVAAVMENDGYTSESVARWAFKRAIAFGHEWHRAFEHCPDVEREKVSRKKA